LRDAGSKKVNTHLVTEMNELGGLVGFLRVDDRLLVSDDAC
jgi:hypothetical protein